MIRFKRRQTIWNESSLNISSLLVLWFGILPCSSLLHFKFALFGLLCVFWNQISGVRHNITQICKLVVNFDKFCCWFIFKFSNLFMEDFNNVALNLFVEVCCALNIDDLSDGLKLIDIQIQNVVLKISKNDGGRFVRCLNQLDSLMHQLFKIDSCIVILIVHTFLVV